MNDQFEQKTLANINIIRTLAMQLGGGTTKSLGQNFLINQNSLLKFIDSIHVTEHDVVIEIGPGVGVVTYTLCERAKKVYLIEIDRNKEPALKKVLENFDNYEIIWGDASQLNFSELNKRIFQENPGLSPQNLKVIGSLPYNVSKKIIQNVITSDLLWQEASFFLQREVADAYVSVPPTAEFLGTYIRIYANVSFAFGIPPEHFMPKPAVKTGVIHLSRELEHNDIDRAALGKFIKAGFTQPRKTIYNNLKSLNVTNEHLEQAGIRPTMRPSEIALEQWRELFLITRTA